jgi:hypothetical protein
MFQTDGKYPLRHPAEAGRKFWKTFGDSGKLHLFTNSHLRME